MNSPLKDQVAQTNAWISKLRAEIAHVIVGQEALVERLLVGLLANGHVLLEGVPGLAKTLSARTLATAVQAKFNRIQFTPDLLPSDVTGVSVWGGSVNEFQFRPGGVFANVLLADEINRASPKTQSALLEAMAERQVTVDNTTYTLEPPFMVIATQNPIEMEGTYALPEAQRDRFMVRLSVGYPVEAAEIAMLDSHTMSSPLEDLEPVTDAVEIRKLIEIVTQVHVSQAVQRYTVALAAATRRTSELALGASPRASLHLVRASKASAAIQGRDYVLPDDVLGLAPAVLTHRLLPSVEAAMGGRTTASILESIVSSVPVPEGTRA